MTAEFTRCRKLTRGVLDQIQALIELETSLPDVPG